MAKAVFLFECTPSIVGGQGCQQHISRSPGLGGAGGVGKMSWRDWRSQGEAQTAVGRVVPRAGTGGWSTPIVTTATEGYCCKSIKVVGWGGGGGGGFLPKFWADLGAVITRLASEFQQKNHISWWLDWQCCPNLAHDLMIQWRNWLNSPCNRFDFLPANDKAQQINYVFLSLRASKQGLLVSSHKEAVLPFVRTWKSAWKMQASTVFSLVVEFSGCKALSELLEEVLCLWTPLMESHHQKWQNQRIVYLLTLFCCSRGLLKCLLLHVHCWADPHNSATSLSSSSWQLAETHRSKAWSVLLHHHTWSSVRRIILKISLFNSLILHDLMIKMWIFVSKNKQLLGCC